MFVFIDSNIGSGYFDTYSHHHHLSNIEHNNSQQNLPLNGIHCTGRSGVDIDVAWSTSDVAHSIESTELTNDANHEQRISSENIPIFTNLNDDADYNNSGKQFLSQGSLVPLIASFSNDNHGNYHDGIAHQSTIGHHERGGSYSFESASIPQYLSTR